VERKPHASGITLGVVVVGGWKEGETKWSHSTIQQTMFEKNAKFSL